MKIFLSLAFLASTLPLHAQQKVSIQVGDCAPDLNVLEWLRDEPLTSFQPGQYYVLEFATVSCPPCRKSIPHLAQLAKTYDRKIRFINVYSSEQPGDTHSYATRIRNLYAKLKDQMTFSVAIDNVQATAHRYGVHAWPDIFVIDATGHVVWRGFMVNDLDAVLEKLLNATLDPQAEKSRQATFTSALLQVERWKKQGEFKQADQQLRALMISSPENQGLLLLYQFNLWVGTDNTLASEILKVMLDDGKDILWEKLTGPVSQQANVLPDELVTQVFNRAYQETSLPEVKASILRHQAHLLSRKAVSREDQKLALQDMMAAQKLIDSMQIVGSPTQLPTYKSMSLQYQYLASAMDGRPSQSLLEDFKASNPERIMWTLLVDDVVKIQCEAAASQMLIPIDECLQQAMTDHNYSWVSQLGERKASMLAFVGDQAGQEVTYKKLIAYFTKVQDKKRSERFQTKLDAL